MAGYAPVESKHYSVLLDPTQDQLLGQYMSRYLESIYPTLTSRFGYIPPGLLLLTQVFATGRRRREVVRPGRGLEGLHAELDEPSQAYERSGSLASNRFSGHAGDGTGNRGRPPAESRRA